MATTTYRTVLPDVAMVDRTGGRQRPINRGDARPQMAAARDDVVIDVHDERPTYPANDGSRPSLMANGPDQNSGNGGAPTQPEYSFMKKLTDNKILTRGLIVVIIVLIILLVVQIMRSRNAGTSEDPEKKAAAATGAGPPYTAHATPQAGPPSCAAPPTGMRQKIDENLYAQYMKKRAVSSSAPQTVTGAIGKKLASMAAYATGRQPADDKKQLDTIMEGSTSEADPEHEAQRAAINKLLREEAADEEDPMVARGTDVVESADQEVRATIAANEQKSMPVDRIKDEALVDQLAAAVADADGAADGGDDSDPEASTARLVPVCTAVLVSGPRAGQQCMRECKTGDRCRHHAKKPA